MSINVKCPACGQTGAGNPRTTHIRWSYCFVYAPAPVNIPYPKRSA